MSDLPTAEPPRQEGAPAWMATFADMMSLLLTFFVLLLSFANMDVVKFKDMLGSVQEALGVKKVDPGEFQALADDPVQITETEQVPPEPVETPEQKMDKELKQIVERAIQEQDLEEIMQVAIGERGVTIRTNGKLMFQPASDELRPEALGVLDEIANMAALFPHMIAVEGHTDDVPIQTERFPSNWELSAARAVSGVRYLIDQGFVNPERISASGYAHTRPIVRERTEEARAKNRRLEFVFYRDQSRETGLDLSDEIPESLTSQ